MSRSIDVLALGTAAGESALARAFIEAAVHRGHAIRAFTVGEQFAAELKTVGAEILPGARPFDVARAYSESRVLVCITSLTCARVLPALNDIEGVVVALDSTWLPWFSGDTGRYLRFDRRLVAMPPSVFHAGLGPNQGRMALDAAVLDRTTPVGWLHAFAPRLDHTPSVFIYLGGNCNPDVFVCRASLGPAIAAVAKLRPDIRWRYLGPPLALPRCVEVYRHWVDEPTLARWHSDADLVICHHGQVTIGRAAAAGVPVLSIIDGVIFRPGAADPHSDLEVHAFARAGIVEPVYGAVSPAALALRIEALLQEGRRPPGGGGGADMAVREIEQML